MVFSNKRKLPEATQYIFGFEDKKEKKNVLVSFFTDNTVFVQESAVTMGQD